MRIEERQTAAVVGLELALALCGTFQKKRIACLKRYLARLPVNTLPLTRHGHKHNVVFLFKIALRHRFADKVAAEGYVCGAHFAICVDIVDAPNVMVGGGKTVRALEFEYLVDLSSINESVATQNPFSFRNGHYHFLVEPHNLDQRAAFNVHQPSLLNGAAHGGIVGGHKQFDGVVACGLEGVLRRFAFRNEPLQKNHHGGADNGEYESRHKRFEHVHRLTSLFQIKARNHQVR